MNQLSGLYDPLAQPPGRDQFGPLSSALGDPMMGDPQAYGRQASPGSGAPGGFLQMLMQLLQGLAAKKGGLPRTFSDEQSSGGR